MRRLTVHYRVDTGHMGHRTLVFAAFVDDADSRERARKELADLLAVNKAVFVDAFGDDAPIVERVQGKLPTPGAVIAAVENAVGGTIRPVVDTATIPPAQAPPTTATSSIPATVPPTDTAQRDTTADTGAVTVDQIQEAVEAKQADDAAAETEQAHSVDLSETAPAQEGQAERGDAN